MIDSTLVLAIEVVPCILQINHIGIFFLSTLDMVGLSYPKENKLQPKSAGERKPQETRSKNTQILTSG